MNNQIIRPRRLRRSDTLRSMVRETRISADALVYPMFVQEAEKSTPIEAMPGQTRYCLSEFVDALREVRDSGVKAVLLFGIPAYKDECASEAYSENGIIQKALRLAKAEVPELYYTTDVCLCEYTSHGHCGMLHGHEVDNDTTLTVLAKTALSHVEAGADMVAPSDMMDGRVAAIREILDAHGYTDVPIMSYAVKYSSSFYGPFREAAGSAPSFGNRKSYQMDYHNRREALREAELDVAEGADIIMVKPGLPYLDVLREVTDAIHVPSAAYMVSGEYAMIKAAAAQGWINEADVVCESATAFFRAGASVLITYFAKELAGYIREGRIG